MNLQMLSLFHYILYEFIFEKIIIYYSFAFKILLYILFYFH